jgi:hypothetical protein
MIRSGRHFTASGGASASVGTLFCCMLAAMPWVVFNIGVMVGLIAGIYFAVVGLIAGIFTLLEKVVRGRPQGWLAPSTECKLVVKIKNPDDQDIAITRVSVLPRVCEVSNSWEFDQLIRAAMVRPGDEIELPLKTRSKEGRELDTDDRRGLIVIRWKRTSSMWCPRIPLFLWFKTSQLTKLRGAKV